MTLAHGVNQRVRFTKMASTDRKQVDSLERKRSEVVLRKFEQAVNDFSEVFFYEGKMTLDCLRK